MQPPQHMALLLGQVFVLAQVRFNVLALVPHRASAAAAELDVLRAATLAAPLLEGGFLDAQELGGFGWGEKVGAVHGWPRCGGQIGESESTAGSSSRSD